MFKKPLQTLFSAVLFFASITTAVPLLATVVVFDTSHGAIEVNLFDQSTPKTVANFLAYVNNGDYDNTVIHRSIPGFITQGGGFRFEGDFPLIGLTPRPSVINEALWSNKRGTIAMAKVGGNVNSATNQWFFNLVDNSGNLDIQNGGFTVFGQVTPEGMQVVDTIAGLSRCSEIPMPNFDCANGGVPGVENFVTINNVTISDPSATSASGLNPVENTLIDASDSSGGGTFSLFTLIALGLRALMLRATTKS